MTLRVKFLGTGDAFAAGGRGQTCVLLDGEPAGRCLLDCGATALTALQAQGIEPRSIDAILLTHLHGDHFAGVPFFLLDALVGSGRPARRPLTVAGPPGTEARVRALGEVLYPGMGAKVPAFPLAFLEMTPEVRHEVAGFAVTPYPAAHSPDSNPTGLRVEAAGKVVAYTGDGGWGEAMIPLGRDADLLIAECSWFVPRGEGHMDYKTLTENLPRIGARRTVITHMGPEVLERLDRLSLEAAFDGLEILP